MSSPSQTLTISPQRVSQITTTIRTYVASFVKPIDSSFYDNFHPDLQWFDHAFLVQRQGHEAAAGLHRAFRHCNQPFDVEIKGIMPMALGEGKEGAVLEQVWVGRCVNDIVR